VDVLVEGAVTDLFRLALGLLPVSCFLAVLVFMDSYKLLPLRKVLQTVVVGCATAVLCFYVNALLIRWLTIPDLDFQRYVAPLVEEIVKSLFVVFLLRTSRVGFLVDAAIAGFAAGTGFALAENIHYFRSLEDATALTWLVRGFGTAVMHGSTTAVFAILGKDLSDRRGSTAWIWYLPGLLIAIVIHSLYNHFFVPALASTAILLMTMPLLVIATFEYSERATRRWLGSGLDADMELLELIRTGDIREDRIGMYLRSLKNRFPGTVVADMLCLLQIQLELSMAAKSVLIARAAGVEVPIDAEVRAKLEELRFLERSIGRTGRLTIAPFLKTSSRELWQFYMLGMKSPKSLT
jgi:RsiW-degrading membrane proteinase PrsW (M82 family)